MQSYKILTVCMSITMQKMLIKFVHKYVFPNSTYSISGEHCVLNVIKLQFYIPKVCYVILKHCLTRMICKVFL